MGSLQGKSGRIEALEALEDEIYSLRRKNHEFRHFIPRKTLLELLQPAKIRAALGPHVPPHQLDEILSAVYPHGRLLFAILVRTRQVGVLPKFIERDQLQLQYGQLDQKLPFEEDNLASIIGPRPAQRFCEEQWEVIPPVFSPFSIQRFLAEPTILPFLRQWALGQGSFGQVYEVEIDPDHQLFQDAARKVVRKDIAGRRSAGDWESELESLATLGLLHHPNIVRLLGFYVHRETPSFLFPKAEGGTLQQLLDSPRPEQFQENSSLVVAIAGLASALAAVHNFTATTVNLELIGCHHDLRPANVLVDGRRFILADFGLAKLKDPNQGSSTEYKVRKGLNIAPECQDLNGNFDVRRVARASDIWALGCIILSVLTYMYDGVDGLDEFEEQRTFTIGRFEYAVYHQGQRAHPAVAKWIDYLGTKTGRAETILLQLARRMLELEPVNRPNAEEVEEKAAEAALVALSLNILAKFDGLHAVGSISDMSTDPLVEETRFQSWMSVVGLAADEHTIGRDQDAAESNLVKKSANASGVFKSTSGILETLEQQLADCIGAAVSTTTTQTRILLPVRQSITSLYDKLSLECRQKAQGLSEVVLLQEHSLMLTATTGNGAAYMRNLSDLAKSRVSLLVAARLGNPPAEKHDEGLLIEYEKLRPVSSGHYQFLMSPPGSPNRILVEVRHCYDPVQTVLLKMRLEAIVRMSQAIEGSQRFGILPCRGFYQIPGRDDLALVWEFPEEAVAQGTCRPTSLHQAFRAPAPVPSLKRKYDLASAVARSLSHIHKLGWVHKNFSSRQLVFFPRGRGHQDQNQDDDPPVWTSDPYLVGFRYSRSEERPNGFAVERLLEDIDPKNHHSEGPGTTEGPSAAAANVHQHPQYRKYNIRYRPAHDYYSLGVVLLEIGLWKPADQIVNAGWDYLEPDQIRTKLLEEQVPWLKVLMGDVYCSIVEFCLRQEVVPENKADTDSEGRNPQAERLAVDFEVKVVAELSRLASLRL